MAKAQIFLSTVSAEFRSYRESLRHDLDRPNVTVKVQEDFIPTGTETLDKLDGYIRQCDAVIHLVGDMTGAFAQAPSIALIRERYPDFATRLPLLEPYLQHDGPLLSYTQWEAWLAHYHRKTLIIATPKDDAPRDTYYELSESQRTAQQEHLARLRQVERYPEILFTNHDNLAAQLWRSKLHDIIPQLVTASAVDRLRQLARSLLEWGKSSWQIPPFVAPVTLQIQTEGNEKEPRSTSRTALTKAVADGKNLVLFGEGGIGKTTLLLDLLDGILAAQDLRMPLYIEASHWAGTNSAVLDYIAESPAARLHRVTANELMELAQAGCVTIAINGWNEINAVQKPICSVRLQELSTTFPALNVVVATRSSEDSIRLGDTTRIQVQGLNWRGQSSVIRSVLEKAAADRLIDLLARDSALRFAARSPLILRGLIVQANKDQLDSSSSFDLLGAVVESFEEENQRRHSLAAPPLHLQHRFFLEALALHLNAETATSTSRQDALPVVSKASDQLVERGLFGNRPDPGEILDALSNHHLLHSDGRTVRFAHQRFQEYHAATRLYAAMADGEDRGLLSDAVNQPFWEDSIRLLAGKLMGAEGFSSARSRLVETALHIDLGFACDLTAACAFLESDDRDLYAELVSEVRALCDSPLDEVADYGIACTIASGLPVFVDRLYPLIESEDQQTRLGTYRVNGTGIAVTQLGRNAENRISAWLPDRQAEFIHETANNPDNYDFLVRQATQPVPEEVRAAAIAALAWNFPASEAAVDAWLKAPPAVQLEPNVLMVAEDALSFEVRADEVRNTLNRLPLSGISAKAHLNLVWSFPDEVGPGAVELVLARLREMESHNEAKPLLAYAEKHAPDRLRKLARELVLSAKTVPLWAYRLSEQGTPEFRAEIFDASWEILHSSTPSGLSTGTVGALADRDQVLRCLREWLGDTRSSGRKLTKPEEEKDRRLRQLFDNLPVDALISVASDLGQTASYPEASKLLSIVLCRIERNRDSSSTESHWRPSSETIGKLVATYENQTDDAEVAQHEMLVHLCCIASHVAPAEFGDLLLKACRLHLDSWGDYRAALDQWIENRKGVRPSNPYLGLYLLGALERWGFEAVPGLLEMLSHPYADELIPEALARIVCNPWAEKWERPYSGWTPNFKNEGADRRSAGRVLQQPDDTHQALTDAVAEALGKKVSSLIQQLSSKKGKEVPDRTDEYASYRVRKLLKPLSDTPSPRIVEPLAQALKSGLIDTYNTVAALEGLVRQGAYIEDPELVSYLEAIYRIEAKAGHSEDWKLDLKPQLCQLMYFVQPPALLSRPLSDYFSDLKRFTSIDVLIGAIQAIPIEVPSHHLLELAQSSATKRKPPRDLLIEIAKALDCEHFSDFLAIIADGTWFAWCGSDRDLESVAANIYGVIGNDAVCLDRFLAACERDGSPLAGKFACDVLALVPDGYVKRIEYGLKALDEDRVGNWRWSPQSMLMDMFTLHIPAGGASFEVHPHACNNLRHQLYVRAQKAGNAASASRRLLAKLELQRREDGRPPDEPRHPGALSGVAWTDALKITS